MDAATIIEEGKKIILKTSYISSELGPKQGYGMLLKAFIHLSLFVGINKIHVIFNLLFPVCHSKIVNDFIEL